MLSGRGGVHSIELVKLHLESLTSILESSPGRIATGFGKNLQILGFYRPQPSEGSTEVGQRGVNSIELVELYLESFVSTLESFPGRIATGFTRKRGFFTSFLRVFAFFSLLPVLFEKKGEVI